MKAKWLILVFVVLGLVFSASIGSALSGPPTIGPTPSPAFSTFTSSNGELGLYLVGTWSLRNYFFLAPSSAINWASIFGAYVEDVSNVIEVVNPTDAIQWAWVTLWDNNGAGLACSWLSLSPNGRVRQQVDTVTTYGAGTLGANLTGTVKVLITDVFGAPTIGAVGYRKEIHIVQSGQTVFSVVIASPSMSEIRLQPVPPAVLFADTNAELTKIKTLCGH